MRSILYIEGCNFKDFPLGGTLSFALQMVQNVHDEFNLVGLGDSNDFTGVWFKKEINGKEFYYYSIGSTETVRKSVLPKRIMLYFMLKKHIKNIQKTKGEADLVFSQTPQFVFLICKLKWKKICFCFAGLGNSVGSSKFKFLRIFGGIYERKLFNVLKNKCDVILAAADQESISQKINLYGLKQNQINSFPTRFNNDIFYPKNQTACRNDLRINLDSKLIVTTGRLSYIKGWRELIESFRIVQKNIPNAKLVFIGDGEDKSNIIEYAKKEIAEKSIELVGRKTSSEICDYLNAADVFAMFSLLEGWPTSMVEAIACGKNVISTNVSGAKDMVRDGENGYILNNRDVNKFAEAIIKSLMMPNPNLTSLNISLKFSSQSLQKDFIKLIE